MITDVDRALLNGLGGDSYSEVSDLALISVYRERAAAEAYALGRIEGAKAMQNTRAPQWQDIAIAPRTEGYDPSPKVLVATKSGRVFVSAWTLWNGGSYQWCNGEGRELPSSLDGTLHDPPTHWTPRPAPPKEPNP